MKRSQIGQALEAGKEAALSSENVSQKFSQYKQEQAKKFSEKKLKRFNFSMRLVFMAR